MDAFFLNRRFTRVAAIEGRVGPEIEVVCLSFYPHDTVLACEGIYMTAIELGIMEFLGSYLLKGRNSFMRPSGELKPQRFFTQQSKRQVPSEDRGAG